MCLAVPMKIMEKTEETGVAEMGGVKKAISFIMCPDAQIGDYVIVHAGFAIEILDEHEANERLKLFREMADLDKSSN
jgi:hydrogenase expression/formation protein HypC